MKVFKLLVNNVEQFILQIRVTTFIKGKLKKSMIRRTLTNIE